MAVAKKTSTKKSRQPLRQSINAFLSRRPHRSFRRTKARDLHRSLKLPGYVSFTKYVAKTLWQYRKLFLLLALMYGLLSALVVGVASQDTYTAITDGLTEANSTLRSDPGQAGVIIGLIATALTGGLSQSLSQTQSTYAFILVLMTWLTAVWLLRNILAGNKVKLRDGLYNASAPILSTFIVITVLILQLLPMALAFIGYSAAASSGLLAGGIEAMLFWIVAGLLVVLSLYLVTSTLVALVIVTLPGMYPMQALKTAGDIAVGRRMRLLMRLLWLVGTIVAAWIVLIVPMVLLDAWINSMWVAFSAVPFVPIILVIMSSLTVVWAASYVYLLYRKVVADDAKPA
jgi:hypothetical protein